MVVDRTIQLINDLAEDATIGDPNANNVVVEVEITDIDTDIFCELIKIVEERPELFSAFSIEISDTHTAFSLRDGRIESGDIDGIEDLDVEADPADCEEGFYYYREQGDLSAGGQRIHEFATTLDTEDNMTLSVELLLDKTAVATTVLTSKLPSAEFGGYNPIFWLNPERLNKWLSNASVEEVIQTLFKSKEVPVLLFGTEVPQKEALIISSLQDFRELSVDTIEGSRERYNRYNDRAREITHWRDDLIPIHPNQLLPLYEHPRIANVESILLLAILGAFAKDVEKVDSEYDFTYTESPEYSPCADVNNLSTELTSGDVSSLIEMYTQFKPNEEDDSFRDLWQRAIANQCKNEPISCIAQEADEITERFEGLRATAVSENFDDLSDVLDDTQSLMADITSRLSDSANDVSRQIQALTFTLLGAVIANIFLVLRWGSKDLVPPFSLFVLVIVVGFYLPLVQGRITDLENTICEIRNDYEFYQKRIRRFNQELFGSKLDSRMEAHEKLAKKQRDRAKKQIKLVFYVSMSAWAALSVWTGFAYGLGLLRTGSLLISALVLCLICGIVPDAHRQTVQHTDYEYFQRNIAIIVLVLVIGALLAQFIIAFTPGLSEGVLSELPRFQNQTPA